MTLFHSVRHATPVENTYLHQLTLQQPAACRPVGPPLTATVGFVFAAVSQHCLRAKSLAAVGSLAAATTCLCPHHNHHHHAHCCAADSNNNAVWGKIEAASHQAKVCVETVPPTYSPAMLTHPTQTYNVNMLAHMGTHNTRSHTAHAAAPTAGASR